MLWMLWFLPLGLSGQGGQCHCYAPQASDGDFETRHVETTKDCNKDSEKAIRNVASMELNHVSSWFHVYLSGRRTQQEPDVPW